MPLEFDLSRRDPEYLPAFCLRSFLKRTKGFVLLPLEAGDQRPFPLYSRRSVSLAKAWTIAINVQ
jgi:hypothetical protein